MAPCAQPRRTVKGVRSGDAPKRWLQGGMKSSANLVKQVGLLNIETRYRYNPDIEKSARYRSGGHSAAAHDDPVNAWRAQAWCGRGWGR